MNPDKSGDIIPDVIPDVINDSGFARRVCQSTVRAWSGDSAKTVAVTMQTNMRMREGAARSA